MELSGFGSRCSWRSLQGVPSSDPYDANAVSGALCPAAELGGCPLHAVYSLQPHMHIVRHGASSRQQGWVNWVLPCYGPEGLEGPTVFRRQPYMQTDIAPSSAGHSPELLSPCSSRERPTAFTSSRLSGGMRPTSATKRMLLAARGTMWDCWTVLRGGASRGSSMLANAVGAARRCKGAPPAADELCRSSFDLSYARRRSSRAAAYSAYSSAVVLDLTGLQ